VRVRVSGEREGQAKEEGELEEGGRWGRRNKEKRGEELRLGAGEEEKKKKKKGAAAASWHMRGKGKRKIYKMMHLMKYGAAQMGEMGREAPF
jgi:hypothetical protein